MNLLSMGMEKMPIYHCWKCGYALLLPAFVTGSQKIKLTAIGAEQEKQGVGFALPA